MNTRERLEVMARSERMNSDRIDAHATSNFVERHMRERLAAIRRYPARNEAAKQQIIYRYEHDLATWVDGGHGGDDG